MPAFPPTDDGRTRGESQLATGYGSISAAGLENFNDSAESDGFTS
jgi:hypothetical protein